MNTRFTVMLVGVWLSGCTLLGIPTGVTMGAYDCWGGVATQTLGPVPHIIVNYLGAPFRGVKDSVAAGYTWDRVSIGWQETEEYYTDVSNTTTMNVPVHKVDFFSPCSHAAMKWERFHEKESTDEPQ